MFGYIVLWIPVVCGVLAACDGIKLDENSTTVRIWSHLKSKGGALLLERPGESKGKPDPVAISLFIQHVRAVDEVQMELVFDMYFRYYWIDDRIAYGEGPASISLPMRLAQDQIWMPDLFIVNAHQMSLHTTLDTNSGVFITKEGKVTVSSRFTLTIHCQMDLRKFPHDHHICGISIESYMFSNKSIKLQWASVDFNPQSTPTAFRSSFRNKAIITKVLSNAVYETAELTINLSRISDHYAVLIYAPSIVLVLLSMLLFWLPLSALLDRTLLGAMLLFSMTVILIGSQYGSPQVGYSKAIDVWLLSCFVFVSASLFEVIFIHLVFAREMLTKPGDQFELMREGEPPKEAIGKTFGPWLIRPDVAHKIDMSLRILHPAAFALFNAIYWGVCTA